MPVTKPHRKSSGSKPKPIDQVKVKFTPSPDCGICMRIAIDPLVKVKMEATASFVPNGTSITAMCQELGFAKPSWYNHLKKHHRPVLTKLVPPNRSYAYVEAEGKAIEHEDSLKENYEGIWDEIMAKGVRGIASGEIEVTGSMLLKAAADKATYKAKRQDQKLDVAKAMYAFASGHKLPTGDTSGDTGTPGQSATGDSPGSN